MCPRVSTGSWSHRTRARLHDDGLSDGGHCFLQVGNQGGDLHHHHVALKQHDNTSRHSAPPTHRAGGGAGEGGGANSKTTQAVIQRLPLTGLGEGQTAWHKLSLCASHITGLGEGQGGQTCQSPKLLEARPCSCMKQLGEVWTGQLKINWDDKNILLFSSGIFYMKCSMFYMLIGKK